MLLLWSRCLCVVVRFLFSFPFSLCHRVFFIRLLLLLSNSHVNGFSSAVLFTNLCIGLCVCVWLCSVVVGVQLLVTLQYFSLWFCSVYLLQSRAVCSVRRLQMQDAGCRSAHGGTKKKSMIWKRKHKKDNFTQENTLWKSLEACVLICRHELFLSKW